MQSDDDQIIRWLFLIYVHLFITLYMSWKFLFILILREKRSSFGECLHPNTVDFMGILSQGDEIQPTNPVSLYIYIYIFKDKLKYFLSIKSYVTLMSIIC